MRGSASDTVREVVCALTPHTHTSTRPLREPLLASFEV